MDVAGLGVDIIEIDRMRTILERTPRFRERVFTKGERAYCDAKAQPEIHYALRFAAKEAVLKALGTGFNGVHVTDVEVENDRYGKPRACLHGNAAELARKQGVIEMHLSLSYTHAVGVANAVAVTEDNLPQVDERIDPRVELASAFKEARNILDEMDGASTTEPAIEAPSQTDEAAASPEGAVSATDIPLSGVSEEA